jgi:hypothetical protein
MVAMQIQLDQVSSKLLEQGGLIGNVYADSVVPAGFFKDNFHKFCIDENFAARLNSASDKDKVRIKVHEKYWGSCRTLYGMWEHSNYWMKVTGASESASRGVPEWLRNGQGRWRLNAQEPCQMVRKYIQSTLEEKLSTSDFGAAIKKQL